MFGRTALTIAVLGACSPDRPSARSSAPSPAAPTVAMAPDAAAPSTAGVVAPVFACGARPVCPAAHPEGERPLVDAIRADIAAGRIDHAAALVACSRDQVHLEADPGFVRVTPSRDSQHLLADLGRDAVLRVFDARTWNETLRIDDAASFSSAGDGLVVVADPVGRSSLWNVASQTRIPLAAKNAGVSARGTAIFWVERTPRRAIAVARTSAPEAVARFPVDSIEAPTLLELPGGRFLASTAAGRHWVLDLETGKVARTFALGGSSVAGLGLADRSLAVLDVGPHVVGFDELIFAPTHAPVVVPLSGGAAPLPLTGRGCPDSITFAISDDGAVAITRAEKTWCLFDLASRKLLGTLPAPRAFVSGMSPSPHGTFVGPNVAVVGVSSELARLGIDRNAATPLVDLGSLDPRSELLFSTDRPPLSTPRALVEPPHDRVWVGSEDGSGSTKITEVRADGTLATRPLAMHLAPFVEAPMDPQNHRIVGNLGQTRPRSCPVEPRLARDACIELPLGGTFALAPSGAWAAGPLVVGAPQWTSPPFVGRNGALGVADVATGTELLRHHAPGFQAVAFTSETELAAFGEDGTLLACSLDTRRCEVIGVHPDGAVVLSDPSIFAVADGTRIASVPPLKTGLRVASVAPQPRLQRQRERPLLNAVRSIVVEPAGRMLKVTDAVTGKLDREVTIDSSALLASATSTPRLAALSGRELSVFDMTTWTKLFTRKLTDALYTTAGTIAIDARGARVALAYGKALTVFDVDGGAQRARIPLPVDHPFAVALSPDGRRAAVVIDVASSRLPSDPHDEPRDAVLLVVDVDAPSKVERIPLGYVTSRGGHGATSISMTNRGAVVLTFSDGRAFLVSPERIVVELARDANDAGLWLRAGDGTVSALGTVRTTSQGVGCLIGPWVIPREVCLPALCTSR